MLERTTWAAIPVAALVVVGGGLGWWGYSQYHEKQALAAEVQSRYEGTFHNLTTDANHLEEELGKALVSGDTASFQGHLRNVWRLSSIAQDDVGNLPLQLMPTHHTQQFLANVGKQTDQWLTQGASPTDKNVHSKLQKMYQQAHKMSTSLNQMQGTVLNQRLSWLSVTQALQQERQQKTDNQIVDGFHKMDKAAGAFAETKETPATPHRPSTNALRGEKKVTATDAKRAVAQVLGVGVGQNWHATMTDKGSKVPEFIVTGSTKWGHLRALVSQSGGHVLSFQVDYQMGKGTYDFSDAERKAESWLKRRGFTAVELLNSYQYDRTGYYVFAPLYKGVPVMSQTISVKVALDQGGIIGYDASNYFYYPVDAVPSRVYSANQLQKRLHPSFQVRMRRECIVKDKNGNYQPAVAFYGTENGETYRVFMNAHTGHEIDIEQLTHHS
ncbi:PepSY1/2 domain-containing protein [Alicyclobacillus herbarius]|uniref:PepSY1/2 domain-containing protein n=1 Tax=Alicyclobacillus herbarius TaxID=122960 RepID=UPI000478B3AA|nr:PepSY1/2 domain-containing protein [Alicyclobacillus herbarius]